MNGANIITVFRYEMKFISRNWTFKVLAVFVVFVMTGFHVFCHSQWRTVETMDSLPACMPYSNAFLYNLLQSFSVLFLAGGFIYRDRVRTTNDALSVRPFGKVDYVIGKTCALIGVWGIVNLAVIGIGLLINAFATTSPFAPQLYVFYLLTLTLPSLVFITCLATALQLFFRSHAFVLLLLLAFSGIDVFYLRTFEHGVLDYTAARVPNFFSTWTGHPDLTSYLLQRAVFLFLAGSVLCFALPRSRRIPNRGRVGQREHAWGIAFLICAVLAGCAYLYPFAQQDQKRDVYTRASKKFEPCAKTSVLTHEITFSRNHDLYNASSLMRITNRNEDVLDSLLFYLNPGLEVRRVEVDGEVQDFVREAQIVVLKQHLALGDTVIVKLEYGGRIDESICYLDIDEREYNAREPESVFYSFGRRYAFLGDPLTLLTPECLWYPVTCSPVNLNNPYFTNREFSSYTLKIVHPGEQVVISQGEHVRRGDTLCFTNPQDLPGITLISGHFVRDSVRCEKIARIDFFNQEHHYPLEGTLGTTQEYKETKVNRFLDDAYPFSKLAFVEIPISFHTFFRPWKDETDWLQAEMIFQREWEGELINYDKLLENYLKNTSRVTMGGLVERNLRKQFKKLASRFLPTDSLTNLLFPGEKKLNPFYMIPLWTRFSAHVSSPEFADIDGILSDTRVNMTAWGIEARSSSDLEAMDYLSRNSMSDAMNDPHMRYLVKDIRRLKGAQLWRYISTFIPWKDFQGFLDDFYRRHAFQRVDFDVFASEFQVAFGRDILPCVKNLYHGKGVPAFWLREVSLPPVREDERATRMLTFKVWNRSNVDGVIAVTKEAGSGRSVLQSWEIKAHECRKINYKVDCEMALFSLDLGISRNNPSSYFVENNFGDTDLDPVEMNVLIDSSCFISPNEIIVDDDDPGFTIVEGKKGWLQEKMGNREKSLTTRDSKGVPEGWHPRVEQGVAYGEVAQRYYFKAAGKGNSRVEWSTQINESGKYKLFIYNCATSVYNWEFPPHHYVFYHDGKEERISLSYSKPPVFDSGYAEGAGVIVQMAYSPKIRVDTHYSDGEVEVIPEIPEYEKWIPAGTYTLSEGTVKLVLNTSGISLGQVYRVDAVKWVKVDEKSIRSGNDQVGK